MLISEIAKSWFLRLTWTIPHQKTPELTWAMFFPCYFARKCVFIYLFIYWFIDLLIDLKNQQRAEHFAADLCWIFPPPTILAALRLSSLSPSCWAPAQQHSCCGGQSPGSHLLTFLGGNKCLSLRGLPWRSREKWHGATTRNARQSTFLSVEYPFAYHCPPAMQICPGLPVLGSLLVWRRLKSESYTSMPKVDRLSASFQDVKQANGSNGKFGQWYVTTNASSQDFLDPIARWLVVRWQL